MGPKGHVSCEFEEKIRKIFATALLGVKVLPDQNRDGSKLVYGRSFQNSVVARPHACSTHRRWSNTQWTYAGGKFNISKQVKQRSTEPT